MNHIHAVLLDIDGPLVASNDAHARVCGADRWIESATSSDDAEESKPDPDILHAAIEKLGLPRDQIAMLGDTPYDVEAARRAGVRVIALRGGGWGDAGLPADGGDEESADLADHLDDSLLGRGVRNEK